MLADSFDQQIVEPLLNEVGDLLLSARDHAFHARFRTFLKLGQIFRECLQVLGRSSFQLQLWSFEPLLTRYLQISQSAFKPL